MSKKIGVFANDDVGNKVVEFLLNSYAADLAFVICINKDSTVYPNLLKFGFNENDIFFNDQLKDENILLHLKHYKVDLLLLAWWPNIVKREILNIPIKGTLNFHPSLLPYNRGKNYNFWTIIEDTPFGVSIHFVDEGIDTGDVIFQQIIEKDWTDTGQSLYNKAKEAILNLFFEKYLDIRNENYTKIPQDLKKGSFRLGKEMALHAKIDLNSNYSGKDLLNLLRAKTFSPYPAAWFEDNGEHYEVTVNIKQLKIKNESTRTI
jgi:methionyl-tRNA formyltransferase